MAKECPARQGRRRAVAIRATTLLLARLWDRLACVAWAECPAVAKAECREAA
jgi:hypothetical protein